MLNIRKLAIPVSAGICLLAVAVAPAQDAKKPAASQPATAKGDMVELKLELPKPLFTGTPKNIKSPNLEKATGKPRPPIMVPKGVVLLSEGKDVSGSDEEPIIGDLEMVTDGDMDGGDGSYVEFGPGKQYVQIDLEESAEIHAILVWHYHSQGRVYRDVIVQLADDPDFITNVRTVFNNDHDNTSGLGVGKDKEYVDTFEGRYMKVKKEKARYVRLYSKSNTSNDLNHYVEVQIYGKPAK